MSTFSEDLILLKFFRLSVFVTLPSDANAAALPLLYDWAFLPVTLQADSDNAAAVIAIASVLMFMMCLFMFDEI
jgi:hypothetical protein